MAAAIVVQREEIPVDGGADEGGVAVYILPGSTDETPEHQRFSDHRAFDVDVAVAPLDADASVRSNAGRWYRAAIANAVIIRIHLLRVCHGGAIVVLGVPMIAVGVARGVTRAGVIDFAVPKVCRLRVLVEPSPRMVIRSQALPDQKRAVGALVTAPMQCVSRCVGAGADEAADALVRDVARTFSLLQAVPVYKRPRK